MKTTRRFLLAALLGLSGTTVLATSDDAKSPDSAILGTGVVAHAAGGGSTSNTLAHQARDVQNGLTPNGLHLNGLHLNGLHLNGLHRTGLHVNGLAIRNGLVVNGSRFDEPRGERLRIGSMASDPASAGFGGLRQLATTALAR